MKDLFVLFIMTNMNLINVCSIRIDLFLLALTVSKLLLIKSLKTKKDMFKMY